MNPPPVVPLSSLLNLIQRLEEGGGGVVTWVSSMEGNILPADWACSDEEEGGPVDGVEDSDDADA